MGDKYTPMEPAEVLEVPEEKRRQKPPVSIDSYGTATPERVKKNHDGLIIFFCILIILWGSYLVLLKLLRVNLTIRNGKLLITLDEGGENTNKHTDTPEYEDLTPQNATNPSQSQPGRSESDDTRLALNNGGDTSKNAQTASEIYEKVSPSVVCIAADTYFGQSTGTGIILTKTGYILTSYEVVSNAMQITVSFRDGESCEAALIASDTDTGFALMKATGNRENFVPAEFADMSGLSVGDTVYTIGNPYGAQLQNVLATGIVSVINKEAAVGGKTMTLLQTTASFDAGNHCCPVINCYGQVVALTSGLGVNFTSDGTDPNLAVAMESAISIAQTLIDDGHSAQNVWLGFELAQIPEAYSEYYEYPGTMWISQVGGNTAADGMLYPYDVVTAVDGEPIRNLTEYQAALAKHEIGDTVCLTIYRAHRWYRAKLPLTTK